MRLRFFPVLFLPFILVFSSCTAPTIQPRLPALYLKALDYSSQGGSFYHKGCFDRALDYYLMAYELFTVTDNRSGVADTLNNIGNIYRQQNNPDESIVFYKKAADIYSSIDLNDRLLKTYCNLAAVHITTGDYAAAGTYLDKTEALINQTGHFHLPFISNTVLLLVKTGKTTAALSKINPIIQSGTTYPDPLMSSFYYAVAQYYDAINNYEQAIFFLKKSLSIDKSSEALHNIATTLFCMGTTEEKNNHPEQALTYFKRSFSIFTLIHNEPMADKALSRFQQSLVTDSEDTHPVFGYFSKLWANGTIHASPCD